MGTISVTLPADLEAELNDCDNRSEFVREAVREKLDAEDGDGDA
jgi:metal-responsive CopG/Arc/MetJ family transcriptional regulator